jgi:uncharacterized protein YbcI
LASYSNYLPTRASSSNGTRRANGVAGLTVWPPGGEVEPLGSAPQPPPPSAERESAGGIAGAISTRLVGLLREHSGRGPTKAKALISSDLVLVTLADCLLTYEQHLVAAGHGELVERARGVLHQAMRADAIAVVEELTHRQVDAYLTAQHHEPDVAILVFYLAPPSPEPA